MIVTKFVARKSRDKKEYFPWKCYLVIKWESVDSTPERVIASGFIAQALSFEALVVIVQEWRKQWCMEL